MTVLEAALRLASEQGFAIFAVAGDGRTPIKGPGYEHGCWSATRDAGTLRRIFGRHPSANMACACGEASGVFVLDVDVKGAVDGYTSLRRLQATYGDLPETWTVKTPSGGRHLYFRQPATPLRNRVNLSVWHSDGGQTRYPGLDVRTTGGSVALPPSRRPDGEYEWLFGPSDLPLAAAPNWLVYIINPPPPPRRPSPSVRMDTVDRVARYVAAAVNGECEALASMGSNTGRNQKLFQAAANLGEFVGADLMPQSMAEQALERAAAECGLAHDDGWHSVRASIASGLRRGMANPRELVR